LAYTISVSENEVALWLRSQRVRLLIPNECSRSRLQTVLSRVGKAIYGGSRNVLPRTVSTNNLLSKYHSVFGGIESLAKNWDLSYYSLRHCNGRDKPEAHKLWFLPLNGNVPLHEEPNLMGFSIYGDRTFPR